MKQNPPIALALRGVSKRFDRPAVDALDLTVYGGEFYVLVGPNGAGKTTTLRMVVGLLRPDAGSICIEGVDALADPVAAKQVTAWLSDEPMIYDKLTPYEYLEFVAGLWRIEPATAEARARDLIGWLGLEPHAPLMQILYLLPPAMLLWVTFHDHNNSFVLLIPVVVMAAGQLAGGLAWLSISGEDAPDLVATAPIGSRRILWAKIEAVIGMIAFVFAPIVAVLTLDSVFAGVVCALGILSAAAAATAIQLCFRVQARRSQFRRRQTSSRLATFAEAFSSIAWAATTALAASASWAALGTALVAFGVLGAVWLISPSRA